MTTNPATSTLGPSSGPLLASSTEPSVAASLPAPASGERNAERNAEPRPLRRGEGRLFGAIVLAAFVLYGVGSSMADEPLGVGLVLLNSVAVAGAGLIGFRLVRARHIGIGIGYLVGRLAEGLLLAGGVVLLGSSRPDADTTGYLLGMLALGLASVPFCRILGRRGWLPNWLANWGVVGYAALAAGAAIELTSGREVGVLLAAPGGLFELVLGIQLLRRGFGPR